MFYIVNVCLIAFVIIAWFAVLRSMRLKEGYENPWLPDYQSWRTKYLKRYNSVCPLYKNINTTLSQAGEVSLEVMAKKVSVEVNAKKLLMQKVTHDAATQSLLDDKELIKNIGDGILVGCDSNNLPPDSTKLDDIVIFFGGFPENSEIILYRTALVVRNLLQMQSEKLKNALNPTVSLINTGSISNITTEGFFAGFCSQNLLEEKQLINDANSCVDPSQLPEGQKIKLLRGILGKHLASLDSTSNFTDIIGEAKASMDYMNKIKEQATNGTLPMPQVV